MRISDWSSDVCSSDLVRPAPTVGQPCKGQAAGRIEQGERHTAHQAQLGVGKMQIGFYRASQDRQQLAVGSIQAIADGKRNGRQAAPSCRPALRGRSHRSEEHTSDIRQLTRSSNDVFVAKKTNYELDTSHI